MAGNVLEVTDENFAHEVKKAEGLTVVDFWAEWCGPCKIIGPVIEELAQEYDGKVRFTKLDVDTNPRTAQQFGIRSIPSILFFKDGEIVDTVIGAVPKAHLQKKVQEHLD